MKPLHANDVTFASVVLESSVPVLVDFHADWCPPCRLMDKTIEEVAGDVGATAQVVKVNVDEAPETAARFGIHAIPTFAVVHRGELQSRLTGVLPKERLLSELQPHLAN